MKDKHEIVLAKVSEFAARAQDLYREVAEALADNDNRACTESGLSLMCSDRIVAVSVPEKWIGEWSVMCDGNRAWVVEKVRDLCFWTIDQENKRRPTEKGARRFLGAAIRKDWKKYMAGRPAATGSLDAYERRHAGE